MTKFIRRRSYIRIEEGEEIWIFEDEALAAEVAPRIDAQPDAPKTGKAYHASKSRRIFIFVLTTALAILTSLAASLIYGQFFK